MKTKIYWVLAIALLLVSTLYNAKAQNNTSNNIAAQPAWGPVGYDHADYYYLPDVQAYYSLQSRQFIYLSNGRWLYAAALPAQYRKYDLYSGYKVVLNSSRPYLNFGQDKIAYAKYKGMKNNQVAIRDCKDAKYHQGSLNARSQKNSGRDYGPE